jgi:hypothetical protein
MKIRSIATIEPAKVTAMTDFSRTPQPPTPEDVPVAAGSALDDARASRRRVLLSGLGRGGAALVAVTPIQSFATSRVITGGNTLCTQSGQMSNIMSRTGSNLVCLGKGPSHYHGGYTDTNWPTGLKPSWNTLTFAMLFPNSTSANKNLLCKNILKDYATSDEAYWIAAFFNGSSGGAASNFPYPAVDAGSGASVQKHHDQWTTGTLTGQNRSYLDLYKNHLSSN